MLMAMIRQRRPLDQLCEDLREQSQPFEMLGGCWQVLLVVAQTADLSLIFECSNDVKPGLVGVRGAFIAGSE
jgi:hypothetical protein